ncbi:MAG: hypothetical protein JXR14_13595 [Paracoccaceae bacterium]
MASLISTCPLILIDHDRGWQCAACALRFGHGCITADILREESPHVCTNGLRPFEITG